MRKYYNESEVQTHKTFKIVLAVIIPIIIFFIMNVFATLIIKETNFPENYESLLSILFSTILSILISALLILTSNLKPIYITLISFSIIILLKIALNLILNVPITFGKQGICAIIFVLIFSLIGTILGNMMKK